MTELEELRKQQAKNKEELAKLYKKQNEIADKIQNLTNSEKAAVLKALKKKYLGKIVKVTPRDSKNYVYFLKVKDINACEVNGKYSEEWFEVTGSGVNIDLVYKQIEYMDDAGGDSDSDNITLSNEEEVTEYTNKIIFKGLK